MRGFEVDIDVHHVCDETRDCYVVQKEDALEVLRLDCEKVETVDERRACGLDELEG